MVCYSHITITFCYSLSKYRIMHMTLNLHVISIKMQDCIFKFKKISIIDNCIIFFPQKRLICIILITFSSGCFFVEIKMTHSSIFLFNIYKSNKFLVKNKLCDSLLGYYNVDKRKKYVFNKIYALVKSIIPIYVICRCHQFP